MRENLCEFNLIEYEYSWQTLKIFIQEYLEISTNKRCVQTNGKGGKKRVKNLFRVKCKTREVIIYESNFFFFRREKNIFRQKRIKMLHADFFFLFALYPSWHCNGKAANKICLLLEILESI